MPNCSQMAGHKAITRRVLIGQLACLASTLQKVRAQTDDDPLRQLRTAHPRLILPDSDLDRVRTLARDHPLAHRVYLDLEKESERLLSAPPTEYKLTGPRLRSQCRRVLDRVSTLALMYRITLREPYQKRAVAELRAAAAFRDWNPAVFSDTAEMTHAFALGYDWLYNVMAPEDRTLIRDAIVIKAIDQVLPIYQREVGWTRDHYNANIICNAGMGLGALAVAGDSGPDKGLDDKCSAVLRYAFDSITHGLATYGVEGSWPEGPAYWDWVTMYACTFFAALQTALGNDYGLSSAHGVDRAGRFHIYTNGPTGRVFNFADSPEDGGVAPEMFWLAKRFANPVFAWSEQKQLERSSHPDAYDLVWFDRDAKSPLQPPPWPPDAIFRGVDIACFRSAWDDPNALFLAVKGGDNKAAHAHLDLGSFVLDAGGVRWASDLGPDDYDLPGYFGRQRWTFYRTRTEAHNTLLIDDQNQDARAEARITRQEFAPDLSWVQIDLSRANPGKVKQWLRRFAMAQRQAILVGDSVRCDQPVEVIWGMMTDAEIVVSGQTATLRKNGWNLSAEIRTPRHAVFDKAPVHSTPPQAANPNFQKLIVRLGDKITELDLNIVLIPYRDGQPKPKITAQFPA
ncbi:MAG TPA: heparinase II/III family protein [Bryobacteraceae bacterium]|nr:heparinase II/III family protein [Bryobacteraceae bacterium]